MTKKATSLHCNICGGTMYSTDNGVECDKGCPDDPYLPDELGPAPTHAPLIKTILDDEASLRALATLDEIANRDSAKSVTVRAEDLRTLVLHTKALRAGYEFQRDELHRANRRISDLHWFESERSRS